MYWNYFFFVLAPILICSKILHIDKEGMLHVKNMRATSPCFFAPWAAYRGTPEGQALHSLNC